MKRRLARADEARRGGGGGRRGGTALSVVAIRHGNREDDSEHTSVAEISAHTKKNGGELTVLLFSLSLFT